MDMPPGGFEELSFECADLLQGPDFGEDFEGDYVARERAQQLPQALCHNLSSSISAGYMSPVAHASTVSLPLDTRHENKIDPMQQSMFLHPACAPVLKGGQEIPSTICRKDPTQCLMMKPSFGTFGEEAWDGVPHIGVHYSHRLNKFSDPCRLPPNRLEGPVRSVRSQDRDLLASLSSDSLAEAGSSLNWDEAACAPALWDASMSSDTVSNPLLSGKEYLLDEKIESHKECRVNNSQPCHGAVIPGQHSFVHEAVTGQARHIQEDVELEPGTQNLDTCTSSPRSESFVASFPGLVFSVRQEVPIVKAEMSEDFKFFGVPSEKPKESSRLLGRRSECLHVPAKPLPGQRTRLHTRHRKHPVSKFPGEDVTWTPDNNEYSSGDDMKGNVKKKNRKSRKCSKRGRPRTARMHPRSGRRGKWEGVDGNKRRKPHNPWTLVETQALIRGVETCGGGKWADIKRLGLQEIVTRTPVDLKDKWRNLLRVAMLPPEEIKLKKIDRRQDLPLELLRRVRELADGYRTKVAVPGNNVPHRMPRLAH